MALKLIWNGLGPPFLDLPPPHYALPAYNISILSIPPISNWVVQAMVVKRILSKTERQIFRKKSHFGDAPKHHAPY